MSDIKIGRMVLGMLQTNCYFVYRKGDETDNNEMRDAICIDPPDRGEEIFEAMRRSRLRLKAIFLTHGHFDHIMGCEGLLEAAKRNTGSEDTDEINIPIYALEAEEEILKDARKNVSALMGFSYTMEADIYVRDAQVLNVAGMSCKVIATPGHTKGGCCYYFEEAGILVSGDTLFQGSTGRTDFPTGSAGTLVRSIRDKLFVLPDETKVYPGHGDSTTIGDEKMYNPFCV